LWTTQPTLPFQYLFHPAGAAPQRASSQRFLHTACKHTGPAIPDHPAPDSSAGINPCGGSYNYTGANGANDASIGDLDGDGEYEIILKWDPSDSKDSASTGCSGLAYLDAYKLNGTRLWRINLGPNIRAGAHYTQFMVYDLDGDGKAEIVTKTAMAQWMDWATSLEIPMPNGPTRIPQTELRKASNRA